MERRHWRGLGWGEGESKVGLRKGARVQSMARAVVAARFSFAYKVAMVVLEKFMVRLVA